MIAITRPAKTSCHWAMYWPTNELTATGTAYTPMGQIVDEKAVVNAVVGLHATGGSTNGVLHLLAIAHEFGLHLDIDEFGAVADRTPIVADLQPGGRFTATITPTDQPITTHRRTPAASITASASAT